MVGQNSGFEGLPDNQNKPALTRLISQAVRRRITIDLSRCKFVVVRSLLLLLTGVVAMGQTTETTGHSPFANLREVGHDTRIVATPA
jgi:hypothetical protein